MTGYCMAHDGIMYYFPLRKTRKSALKQAKQCSHEITALFKWCFHFGSTDPSYRVEEWRHTFLLSDCGAPVASFWKQTIPCWARTELEKGPRRDLVIQFKNECLYFCNSKLFWWLLAFLPHLHPACHTACWPYLDSMWDTTYLDINLKAYICDAFPNAGTFLAPILSSANS